MTRQNGLKIQRKIDNMKKRNEKRIILETNEKTCVQMAQMMECDGRRNSCLLLGLKGAATTKQDKSGSVDVQH